MAKNFGNSVNLTEKDYVRKSVAELRLATAKKALDRHFRNAPVDDGQLAVLMVREAFKKGDNEHPLYFGTLEPVKTHLVLPTGEEMDYTRASFGDIFLGTKKVHKPGKRSVFVVRYNGSRGVKGDQSTMTASAAKQMDLAIFKATCDAVLTRIDFDAVQGIGDVVLCNCVVKQSQVFNNGNRMNLHIDFEEAFDGDPDQLVGALGIEGSNIQVFIAKKSAVVMWEKRNDQND
jgi:hypothetical protein